MQIAAGVRIGAFEVRALIGAGGMGTVYRARDTRLGRDVAIKVLQEKFAGSGDYLRRFEREARSASALNHPNIVTVFEIGEYEGAPFIAMEIVDGLRLRDILASGAISLRRLLKIATQLADGLAAAHDRGIIHRDIKPENVMITPQGLVKILDFGLARSGLSADPEESTAEAITDEHDRRPIGTAGYMSPEQAAGASLDFRSDQFSLGAVMYEMATGKRAFRRDSTSETLHAIIHDEPPPIATLNPAIPAPLSWIIERCLAKDPQERYASTTDLARELETLRDRLSDSGSGDRLLPAFGGWTRRRWLTIAATAAGIAVAAIVSMQRGPLSRSLTGGAQHLAVLPFRDASGRADDQLFSKGLADAVSSRLARFHSFQVIPSTTTGPLLAKGLSGERLAQEVGATLFLDGTLRRSGERVEIRYAIVNAKGDVTLATDTVSGSAENIWAIKDELSNEVASRLGAGEVPSPTELAELETTEEQELYLRALGNLQNYEDQRSVDAALAQLRELLETASNSPMVHAALARAYVYKYISTKDRVWSEKALQAANRSRTLGPDVPDVVLASADVQRLTGRYADAVTTFKRALTLQPNSPEGVLGLANSYQGNGQFEEAERAFRRGIALRPAWWSGHNDLGAMYLNRGRYDDAAGEFTRVTQLNPQNAWGFSNLGVAHIMKERLPEAISALTRALALREDASAYGNLGHCYYYLGQYEKSVESYRKAVSLRPKGATQWANLSDACRWTSRCANEVEQANLKAIELLNEELAVNPKNARAHATLAVCLAKAKRHRESQDHMGRALALDPANPTRMFQAARVANLSGDFTAAVTWLRRAVDAGYGKLELERDPEFRALRSTEAFRSAFDTSPRGT